MLPAYRDRPSHFQPSSTSDLGDFGILGLSKAERRDRKRRRAARLAKRRKKLEAKGKGESRRAKRLTRRTSRLGKRSAELDAKVRKKMGLPPLKKTPSSSPRPITPQEGARIAASLRPEHEQDMIEGEWDEDESAEGPNMALIAGAVVVAGLVGWMVLKK